VGDALWAMSSNLALTPRVYVADFKSVCNGHNIVRKESSNMQPIYGVIQNPQYLVLLICLYRSFYTAPVRVGKGIDKTSQVQLP